MHPPGEKAAVIVPVLFCILSEEIVLVATALFLETQRFDRSGEYGRMPMISLQRIGAEFAGLGSGWPRVLGALCRKKLISGEHLYDAEVLPYNFIPPDHRSLNLVTDISLIIKRMARDFWERVANDERISGEFNEFLQSGNPMDLME